MDKETLLTILVLAKTINTEEWRQLVDKSKQASRRFEDISPVVDPFAFFNRNNQFMNKREKLIAEAITHVIALSEIAKEIEKLEMEHFD